MVNGTPLKQPQVPVTLPTYDEVIGRNGIGKEQYNDYLLAQIKSDRLNVLTIHAEVEGIRCKPLFQEFLTKAKSRGIQFQPLEHILHCCKHPGNAEMRWHTINGREGQLSCQVPSITT